VPEPDSVRASDTAWATVTVRDSGSESLAVTRISASEVALRLAPGPSLPVTPARPLTDSVSTTVLGPGVRVRVGAAAAAVSGPSRSESESRR
jgi:hypothetical protein